MIIADNIFTTISDKSNDEAVKVKQQTSTSSIPDVTFVD